MVDRLTDLLNPIVDGILLPTALAFIMFSIGLSLRPADFRRVLQARRALVAGGASMMLIVPIVGIGIAIGASHLLELDPAITTGLMLLATCPSGILSNVLTSMAKGDVALSISISVVLSVAYIGTLPLLLGVILPIEVIGATGIPLGPSVMKILSFTLLPVSAGMLTRAAAPSWVRRAHPRIRTVASLVLFALFAWIVVRERDVVAASLGGLVAVILLMNLSNLCIALGVGAVARLSRPERRTLVVEHLIRQEGTAIFVAVSILGSAQAAVPMILNTFIGLIGCAIAMVVFRDAPVPGGIAIGQTPRLQ